MKRERRFQHVAIFFFILVLGSWTLVLRAGAESDKAQEKPWERFSLNLGGGITFLKSDVRIGSESTGISVNVEDALGLDTDMVVLRAEGILRLGESRRHRLDFGYFDLSRSGTKTTGRDITIGNTLYPTGTTVDTEFDLKLFKGAYSYSLVQDDRIDFGLGAGLYVAPIDFRVSNSVSGAREESSSTSPLPFLELHIDYALTPKLFLKQKLDLFYAEYKDFKGRLVDASIGLEYNIWKHFGLGLAFNIFSLHVEDKGDATNLKGSIDLAFSGLMLYGKVMYW
jgi:hypothetical protein